MLLDGIGADQQRLSRFASTQAQDETAGGDEGKAENVRLHRDFSFPA
jgi:hypothetical protein